jgi:hypothetical protein
VLNSPDSQAATDARYNNAEPLSPAIDDEVNDDPNTAFLSAESSFEDMAPDPSTVYSSLRLPEFWSDKPKAWFHHLESECELRNPPITKSTVKYHLACTALPASIRAQIHEILDDPAPDPYEPLKAALLALFTKTPLEEGYEFLELPELGDQLATTQYRRMWKLWNKDGLAVFRAAFLTTLPMELRSLLVDGNKSTKELAELADEIIKNKRAGAKADSRSAATASASTVSAVSEINAFQKKKESSERSKDGLCFVHRKYGKEAYSCRGHCSMANLIAKKPDTTAGKDSAGR